MTSRNAAIFAEFIELWEESGGVEAVDGVDSDEDLDAHLYDEVAEQVAFEFDTTADEVKNVVENFAQACAA